MKQTVVLLLFILTQCACLQAQERYGMLIGHISDKNDTQMISSTEALTLSIDMQYERSDSNGGGLRIDSLSSTATQKTLESGSIGIGNKAESKIRAFYTPSNAEHIHFDFGYRFRYENERHCPKFCVNTNSG